MTESYVFEQTRPVYSSLDEALGTYLSLVQMVSGCENYVETEKAILLTATKVVNATAAVVRMRLL